ncbi:hypothetical protein [Mycobacterium sp. 852002-50816_SCH5313054-b]|uniref:hypothetical protein n=1 Tax=Mycobacterium sp. 852002-50816_SCH5313054-b TaxID=1834092 RepID=UPI003519451D
MPTTDYSQQMLAYLQGWRQLLEQWTAIAAASSFMNAPYAMPSAMPSAPPGMPFMPPSAPFMPPMPPTAQVAPAPPAPADYTQQLFAYLQAWRQYLEQTTGATPGSAQAPPEQQPTAQPADTSAGGPPTGGDGKSRPPRPPVGPTPPGDGGGGTMSTSGARKGSTVTWPPVELLPPGSYTVTQISGPVSGPVGPFVSASEHAQVLSPPEYDFGYQFNGPRRRADPAAAAAASSAARRAAPYVTEAAAQQSLASPFSNAMERVEFGASPSVARRSLYSSAGAEATGEILRQVRETPSP